MSEKKIIAVVGATGQQGGGLVRAVLAEPEGPFAVRALTRNTDSDQARRLTAAGAEVVAADLDDEAGLVKAFEGAYGAFVVTNFFAQQPPELAAVRTPVDMEREQAATAARAAKAAGLRHVVWSTLEDTRPHFDSLAEKVPLLLGGYPVPHFDGKAEGNAFFIEAGVPTTFLQTAFYYEALLNGLGPTRSETGDLILILPMADRTLAAIASEDIGRSALGIFKAGSEYIGKTVSIAGAHVTGEELATKLTRVLGEKVAYRPVSWEMYRSFDFPIAVEMGNMFQFYAQTDVAFTGARDLERTRKINPHLEPLDTWLEAHEEALRPA